MYPPDDKTNKRRQALARKSPPMCQHVFLSTGNDSGYLNALLWAKRGIRYRPRHSQNPSPKGSRWRNRMYLHKSEDLKCRLHLEHPENGLGDALPRQSSRPRAQRGKAEPVVVFLPKDASRVRRPCQTSCNLHQQRNHKS